MEVFSSGSGLVPVAVATSVLGIDPLTLRRWCSAAGIVSRVDAADRRRRYLLLSDLVALAQLHHRYLSHDALAVLSSDNAGQCCPGLSSNKRSCDNRIDELLLICSRLVVELAELRRMVNDLSAQVQQHG